MCGFDFGDVPSFTLAFFIVLFLLHWSLFDGDQYENEVAANVE